MVIQESSHTHLDAIIHEVDELLVRSRLGRAGLAFGLFHGIFYLVLDALTAARDAVQRTHEEPAPE